MSIFTILNPTSVYEQLTNFANLENFWESFDSIYGNNYNKAIATTLQSQWQSSNFTQIPKIEVISSDILGDAKGAYAINTNTIYLSDSFLETASLSSINAVILEEIGHFVDAQINNADTPGDEGEYFAKVVQGITLTTDELNYIKTEDDHAIIFLNSESVSIEQASYDLGLLENPTISDGDSLKYSDQTDVWSFQLDTMAGGGSNIALTSTSNYADLTLNLYDEQNNLIAQAATPAGISGNNETLSIEGLAPGNYHLEISDANNGTNLVNGDTDYNFSINLTNNPISPPPPQLSINSISTWEGDVNAPNALLTVTLSAPATDDVSVDYSLTPVNATPGLDYTDISGTLIFVAGETSKTIAIPILSDNLIEGNETFNVNLSNPLNATIANPTGTVTIVDSVIEINNTLESSVTTTLPSNIDNLVLVGTQNIDGTGNANNNSITGNGVDNKLNGEAGDDILNGLGGNDVILGGDGNDQLIGDGDTINNVIDPNILTPNVNIFTPYTGNPSDLAQAILGTNTGITITNANYTGAQTASSTFSSVNFGTTATSSYVLGSGILMTTGDGQPPLTNTLSYYSVVNAQPGDANIEQIIQNVFPGAGITYDAAVLELNFTTPANTNSISLDVMFGSDEYPEWADTSYVDIAGIIVDGVNYGLFNQNPNQPLSILSQNIIDGNLTDNTAGILSIEYDGISSPLRVVAQLGAGTNHTLKIAIADTGDEVYDSGIFISNLQISNQSNTNNGVSLINNDTLDGGNGNDYLDGGIGDDSLDGGTGIDTLDGDTGNDTYVVDDSGDIVIEESTIASEIDAVKSSVNYILGANLENLTLTGTIAINATGNALNNVIIGNIANNILNGDAGIDTLIGGLGNDTYQIDSTTDTITEAAGEGTDTVQSSVDYTLGANVENLTLIGTAPINGTGNALNNVITGNTDSNILNGGAGIDTLIGGLGDDIYQVDSTTDTITELASQGTDTVQSSVTFSIANLSNIENLTLTGTAVINATGNGSNNVITGNTGNNSLAGGAGNDTLNGDAGIDTLIGGLGDDVYQIDTTTDTITEASSQGTDTVQSSVTYTLGANVENLILTGVAAINGTGNTLNNSITGNTANNTLSGSSGVDTLTGNNGSDTLVGGTGNDIINLGLNDGVADVFRYASGDGSDTINEFVKGLDKFAFTGITAVDVKVSGTDTQIRLGNGIAGDTGFGTGTLLATIKGVIGFTAIELGVGGTSLDTINTAKFLFT